MALEVSEACMQQWQYNGGVLNTWSPYDTPEYDLYSASLEQWNSTASKEYTYKDEDGTEQTVNLRRAFDVFDGFTDNYYAGNSDLKSFYFTRPDVDVLNVNGDVIGSINRGNPATTYSSVKSTDEYRKCKEVPCSANDPNESKMCLRCISVNPSGSVIPRTDTDQYFNWIGACQDGLKNCHKCPTRYADVNATMYKDFFLIEYGTVKTEAGCEYLIGQSKFVKQQWCHTSRKLCPKHCGDVQPWKCNQLDNKFGDSLRFLRNLKNGETRFNTPAYQNIDGNGISGGGDVALDQEILKHTANAYLAKAACENLPELQKCQIFCNMEGFQVLN